MPSRIGTPCIRVERLTVGYGKEIILENMDLEFKGYGVVQILGPNGAGKTTLLKTILGLIKPLKGKVYVNRIEVTGKPEKAGPHIGYVPQLFTPSVMTFPVTPWELVESSLLLYRKRWPRILVDINVRKRVEEVLKLVGLPKDTWDKSLWELSGGQRQRVLIARALVHDPPILIMDEPLAAVDPAGRAEIAALIGLLSEKKLVVTSSHDPMLLLQYTKQVVLLNRRIYIAGKPKEVLTLENTRKIYGESVIPVKDHVHISDAHIP